MNVRDSHALLVAAVSFAALAATDLAAQQQPQQPPAATPAAQEAENPVLAKVGAQELRLHDLLAELNRQIPLTFYHAKVPENRMLELRRKAFDLIVERALVHQDALARAIDVTDADVEAEFRRALQSSDEHRKATPAQLDEHVQKLLPQFRPLVVRRLLIDRNEARFRSSVPKPDDAAVKAVYERLLAENAATLQAPAEAHLQHIYVAVDPAGGEKAAQAKQKKIDEAQQQLVAGKAFEDVAKAFSEDDTAAKGGDLGKVKAGFFKSSEIEKVAFALTAGQVSAPFRTLYGFHIVRCLEVTPRRNLTIEETRPLLEQWFLTEHTQRRRAVWLQELKQRYPVEVFSEEFAAPPAEAPDAGKKG